jgi:hypothetical protein
MKLTEAPWTFTSPAVMILNKFSIFLVSTLIWKKCLQNQEPPTPVPSAPLMPMPVINLLMHPPNPRPINNANKSTAKILLNTMRKYFYHQTMLNGSLNYGEESEVRNDISSK